MNPVELLMRQRNTKEFREADRFDVVFVRKAAPEKSPAGGYRPSSEPPTELECQPVRIVHNTRRYKNGLVNAESGDIPNTDYLLLGSHTLDVEVNDTFKWRGDNYKITGIHPFREESTLCSIEFDGPDNRHG